MSPDTDFDPTGPLPEHADALTQDLQLRPVLAAMGGGDPFIQAMATVAVMTGCADAAEVDYRQRVLVDCSGNLEPVTELYTMSSRILEDRKRIHRTAFFGGAESQLHMSITVLETCLPYLARLHELAETAGPRFVSPGFRHFWDTIHDDLSPDYLATLHDELRQVRLQPGLLLSAALGTGNTGVDFLLRTPGDSRSTPLGRFLARQGLPHRPPVRPPTRSMTIPDRDDATFNALSDLRNDVLADAATAAAECVSHVIDFFTVLRQETAFYLGCVNLADALERLGHGMSIPSVHDLTPRHRAAGLYDASLALETRGRAVPSNLTTEGRPPIVLITGANRGGKSTFLRALGIAALLARCGCYAPALSYQTPFFRSVHTHFRREEDRNLASGKFDEELDRLSAIVDEIQPGSLLLSNESFSSTNEREGSQIADEVLRAFADSGVHVVMVTHMYELARRLQRLGDLVAFLRAERLDDGTRTFHIVPGAPELTSYAADLYTRLLGPGDAAEDPSRASQETG